MAPADPILDMRFTLMVKIEGALKGTEVFWDLIPLPFLDSGVCCHVFLLQEFLPLGSGLEKYCEMMERDQRQSKPRASPAQLL
jgi:hypothetical protein